MAPTPQFRPEIDELAVRGWASQTEQCADRLIAGRSAHWLESSTAFAV